MEQAQLDAIRRSLEDELASVERQLSEHGASPNPESGVTVQTDNGFADSAAATAERAELLSLVEGLQKQHAEVRAALARMDEGRYGKCEHCGQDIPFERLEAIPTARLCVACKQAGA